jgi:diketogulonate reductase-like aldo/keto reductase
MDRSRRALLRCLGGVGAALLAGPARGRSGKRVMSRKIPSTGEEIPAIGLGTWQVFDVGGGAAARAPLVAVLQAFSHAGGKLVDSSPMYGASESVLGDLAAQLALREKLFVATKVWTSGREDGIAQMETSFRRLKVKTMDLMQVHNLLDVDTHTRTLEDWKAKKRVRYIGITHYTASAHAEVERQLKKHKYDFLQINYSLAERDAEKRLLPYCRDNSIAVIANRPFAEGALFRRVRGRELPAWTEELGAGSWAQVFLKWIIGHPAITCAIPGTGRPEHMADNVTAGFVAPPDEAMRRKIAAYFDSL